MGYNNGVNPYFNTGTKTDVKEIKGEALHNSANKPTSKSEVNLTSVLASDHASTTVDYDPVIHQLTSSQHPIDVDFDTYNNGTTSSLHLKKAAIAQLSESEQTLREVIRSKANADPSTHTYSMIATLEQEYIAELQKNVNLEPPQSPTLLHFLKLQTSPQLIQQSPTLLHPPHVYMYMVLKLFH